jgi:putative ABC transport system substrate-binding protein
VIGFLSSGSATQFEHFAAAFRTGLRELGFVEGQNVLIEYRWAAGNYDRLPALVAELVNRPVTALAATGGSAPFAKPAAATVPVVFITTDPVRSGLVTSLSRPDGNMTGVAMMSGSMGPKRLELLRELLSPETRLAALVNPTSHIAPSQVRDVQEASRHVGRSVEVLSASTEPEIEAAFADLGRTRPLALLVTSDPFFNSQRAQIVTLAARHSVPAIYEWREFVEAGGLMSYGTSLTDVYRQAGVYTGRILQGAKPADLPVLRETKLELVINLKVAKGLGLSVPPSLLAQTDEVIE